MNYKNTHMDQTLIRANEIKNIQIDELLANPKNPNIHSTEQIERLVDIIRYQGFRRPVTVSNQTGYVVVGHGRIEAAKKLGMKFLPVSFQDYDDETQEYADMVADNSIDDWSTLDLSAINAEVPNLGPDFDIDLLGIKDFVLDVSEFKNPEDKKNAEDKEAGLKTCPNCGVLFDG